MSSLSIVFGIMYKLDSPVPFGHAMRDLYFSFGKGYMPLNHGSFGTFPKVVRDRQCELQDLMEARPDTYLRYTYLELLEQSRTAIAPLLGVSVDEVVFVPNATTGVNTVLHNLTYQKGDVILHFSTVYGACEKTVEFLCENTQVEKVCVALGYPEEDESVIGKFKAVVRNLKEVGKNIKVAIFDTVLTFTGVRFPWENLVTLCKEFGILSLIDGAHGIGHIDLTNLGEIGPDFLTRNCYKWLFVPRGCTVLYVPPHNQHLVRSSVPTSWGFQSQELREAEPRDRKAFGELFKKVSTIDPSPYVCIRVALEFRKIVCGGEAEIREYCENIAKMGGKRMAEILPKSWTTRPVHSSDAAS